MKHKFTLIKSYNNVLVMYALRKCIPNLSLAQASYMVNNLPFADINSHDKYSELISMIDGVADFSYEKILSEKEKIDEVLASFNKKSLDYAIKWRKSLSIHDRICHEFLIRKAIEKAKING